ncbi:MAG: hypothetical protein IJD16_00375 [Desulfovibrio sp.]|nr:hypothetical protein [Desulfovibrio sp.]
MAQLSQLLNRLPESRDVHMSTMGHVLWVCWHDTLPSAVSQTLVNYGGMLVKEEHEQALWFFFTDDVFLALARLMVWGNFNDLPVSIELFPGRLQLSSKREASLSLDGQLRAQEMLVRDDLEVWVHPKSREGINALPGITFESRPGRQGMASVDWAAPQVDVRMPYASTQAWYALLRPLGSQLDKAFQAGWSAMFKRLESLLAKHKIKFIVHETFVILAVDNLHMLRTFMRDYLQTFNKENSDAPCWPCVCVVADRKNLNFNIDLPKKIGLQWDKLMPDFPYISYRNAFLLGEGFTVRDVRYTGEQTSMDNWCNILLDQAGVSSRSIPLMMAGQLTGGSGASEGCFYCGLPGHTPVQCPTRTFYPSRPDLWDDVAGLGLDNINEAFRQIEGVLAQHGIAGFEELLEGDDDTALLLQAIMDINGPGQLRNVPRHWLYRLREPDPDEEKPARDDSPAWELLEKLSRSEAGDLPALEQEVGKAIARHQRDPRLRMVRAFLYIENNDLTRASAAFREAAGLTPAATLQAWNEYLQARLAEEQGQYGVAIEQYNQVWRVMPQWRDVQYRGIVCRVKMGFAEQILDQLIKLVREEPHYFNRVLIDPALERGRLLILSALYDIWAEARKKAEEERERILAMKARLAQWFTDDHPVLMQLGVKIKKLEGLSDVNNYIAFLKVVERRPQLEKELEDCIQREVEELRNRYKYCLDVLQEIRDEASWFPFPTVLREFSADFNESAGLINWAFASNFNDADTFKRAQGTITRLSDLLRRLKRRLRSLRMVRDGTLFALIMGKTFIWVEIIGLLLCFIGVPVIVFWGDSFYLGWLKDLLGENQWSIQKVLAIIVTIIALGVGALRTTIVFDRKREKLLEEARAQREKAQQMRLERIRRQRQAEAEHAKRIQQMEQEREQRKALKEKMNQ